MPGLASVSGREVETFSGRNGAKVLTLSCSQAGVLTG